MVQVVKSLHSKQKALSSTPSIAFEMWNSVGVLFEYKEIDGIIVEIQEAKRMCVCVCVCIIIYI
jgi:hypothetical protein